MFKFSDEYKTNKKIAMKDFIPKDLKPEIKKKIKDNVLKVTLAYQIMGEKIPSIINDTHNYQVIQVYDFEVKDIKKAMFLGNLYQEIIKAPCILRIFDSSKEIYSLALKRLNQLEQSQIIVTDSILTSYINTVLPDTKKCEMEKYIAFDTVVNKSNKLYFYDELFVKLYILEKEKIYSKIKIFLDTPLWYDHSKVIELYALLKTLETNKNKLIQATTNAEKVKINQEIKSLIQKLEEK